MFITEQIYPCWKFHFCLQKKWNFQTNSSTWINTKDLLCSRYQTQTFSVVLTCWLNIEVVWSILQEISSIALQSIGLWREQLCIWNAFLHSRNRYSDGSWLHTWINQQPKWTYPARMTFLHCRLISILFLNIVLWVWFNLLNIYFISFSRILRNEILM